MNVRLRKHNGTPTVFIDGQPAFFGCQLIEFQVELPPASTALYFTGQANQLRAATGGAPTPTL